MSTTYVLCPGGCGEEMWVRFRVHTGRGSEPDEAEPVEWACPNGCEPEPVAVQRAVESSSVEVAR